MSCNCCPTIIFGDSGGGGGGGTPPPCVSAAPDNVLVQDGDGCLYVPPSGPPALSVDPCNAAEAAADGLLVPRTDLVPAADSGPAPTGTERSVVIDTTRAEGCPDTWTVGARLAMVSGFKNSERGHADLFAVPGEDVPIPESAIVLPEVGTYHVDADVRYLIGTDVGGSGYIVGWLSDELNNLLTSFTQIAVVNSPNSQDYDGGTTHIMSEFLIGTAPRTVSLHLMFVPTGGTMSGAAAGGSDSNGATRMRFLKIRD